MPSLEVCRTQITGLKTTMKPRTGVETASATRSEYSSATPFGTSSPTTTWRNVMIRNASPKAISDAKIGSNTLASTCSPSAPIARLVAVTPSCIAAMKRAGSATIRTTARARRSPFCASSWIRVLRAVTSPYSAATKYAFSKISAATPRSSRKRVTPRSPGRGY